MIEMYGFFSSTGSTAVSDTIKSSVFFIETGNCVQKKLPTIIR